MIKGCAVILDAVSRELNRLLIGAFDLVLKVEQAVFRGTRFNDLTLAEIHTIDAIGSEERSMGEVAGVLGVTLATLNSSIGRLCAKGYVQRRRTEADRRLVLVKLTRLGQIVFRLHARFHDKLISRSVAGLSEEEREILAKALFKIRLVFEEITSTDLTDEEEEV